MEIAKLIIELIQILIWPLVVISFVFMFRKGITQRLKDVKEVEFPGGFKAKLNEAKKEAIIEEITNEVEGIQSATMASPEKTKLVRQVLNEKFKSLEQVENSDSTTTPDIQTAENIKDRTMLAFAVGDSLAENKKFNLYYDPADRNHNNQFKYIGLYNDKIVKSVGEVTKIVQCDLIDGRLVSTNPEDINRLSSEEYNRIKGVMEQTEYYDIRIGHKFYLVDAFYDTNYIKASDYGLRAKKYFWLDEIKDFYVGMSASQLAKILNGKSWY